jgi:spore coat polysaccharide biosynthesis protein SpsF
LNLLTIETGVMKRKTLTILQARMSSNRLPGKVMMEINGMPMIHWQIQRIRKAKSLDHLIVATSSERSDDALVDFLIQNSVDVFRGPIDDVLSRFINASSIYQHNALIRLTGDCPLVMPELIDEMVGYFFQIEVDYLSNTLERTFPKGLDIEILKNQVLNRLFEFELTKDELEHVTLGVYTRPEKFKLGNFSNPELTNVQRWTVDYEEDLELIREIYAEFTGRESEFKYDEVCLFLERNPELTKINAKFN